MSTNTIDSETKNDSTKHSVPSAASKTVSPRSEWVRMDKTAFPLRKACRVRFARLHLLTQSY